MKLFIGCSSRDNIPNKYYGYCKDFLGKLFDEHHDLVFGACGKGLMGLSYNIALDKKRHITGIYPEAYKEEIEGLQCLDIPVKTVSERTDEVIKQSDALVFLPGGIGTIYELFTAIESKRAKEHNKPIVIYNCCNFFDNIIFQLDKMYDENFTSTEDKEYFYVCSNLEQAINYLNNYDNQKKISK